MRDAETTIGNLADKQTVAFIGAEDEEGFPVVKAMLAPRKREGIKVFYFTTNTSSRHTAQYRENPKACIYFCDRRFFRGAMLKGTMEILEDSESKEMIWREGDTLYYPGGVLRLSQEGFTAIFTQRILRCRQKIRCAADTSSVISGAVSVT